jgi:hypothetical protein
MTSSPPADERRTKALELHLAGATYEAIAKAVGYASRSGAHKAVQEALKELGDPPSSSEANETELARLDAMLTGLWPKARRGDVQAIDRVLKISERREQILLRNSNGGGSSQPKGERTGLSEFERRRAERQATSPGRPAVRNERG